MSHDAPPHAPEHQHEQDHGWRHAVAERLISIRTMDRPLRLATGLAVAWILAAALLMGLRDHGPQGPITSVYVVESQLVTMHVPVLVCSVLLLCVAWAYLLSAAVHSHLVVRLLGLGVFSWAMWDELIVPHDLSSASAVVRWVLLGGIWVVAGLAHLYDLRSRRRGDEARSHLGRLVLLTAAALFLLCGGIYLATWLQARGTAPLLFTETFTAQLDAVSVILIPVLFIAGVDFADFGQMTADFVGRGVARARSWGKWLLLGAVAAGGLASFGWQMWRFRHQPGTLGQELLTGLVALLLVAVVIAAVRLPSRRRAFSSHVPYMAIAILAAFSFTVLYLYLYLPGRIAIASESTQQLGRVDATLGPYNHDGDPRFSVEHPQLWETHVDADNPTGLTIVHFDGFNSGDPAVVELLTAPTSTFRDVPSAVTGVVIGISGPNGAMRGQNPYLRSAHAEKGWEVFEVGTHPTDAATKPMQARLWARVQDGRAWVIVGFSYPNLWSFNAPGFDAVANSWQPSLRSEAPAKAAPQSGASDVDRAVGIDLAVLAFSALVLIVWSHLRSRRQGSGGGGGLATAALFAGLVAVFDLLAVPGSLLKIATGSAHGLVGLHIDGIQAIAGLGAAGLAAWTVARRRLDANLRPLLAAGALLLALQIVYWVYDLFNQAMDASGRFSIAQAVIVVLALVWDISMSGEAITNGGNRWLPRHARVAAYFGYVLLVVANVLYFSSLDFPGGGHVEAQFESDAWVQSGVILLGIPLLVTMFAVRVGTWWRERPATAAPAAASAEAAA